MHSNGCNICPPSENRDYQPTFSLQLKDIQSKHLKGNSVPACNFLPQLGPGRPSAGGPRMDRRAVTSLGVAKISCRY